MSSPAFQTPPPDLTKLVDAWEAWEKGDEAPGRTLSNLKTAGMRDLLASLVTAGWTP